MLHFTHVPPVVHTHPRPGGEGGGHHCNRRPSPPAPSPANPGLTPLSTHPGAALRGLVTHGSAGGVRRQRLRCRRGSRRWWRRWWPRTPPPIFDVTLREMSVRAGKAFQGGLNGAVQRPRAWRAALSHLNQLGRSCQPSRSLPEMLHFTHVPPVIRTHPHPGEV